LVGLSLVGQLERDPLHHRTIVCVAVRRRFRGKSRSSAVRRGAQRSDPDRSQGACHTQAELEPAGELVFKGIHRPVASFNVFAMRELQA
jgi:hypothetical protein